MFTATVAIGLNGSLDVRIDGAGSVSLRYVVELARVAADVRAMELSREPAELSDTAR